LTIFQIHVIIEWDIFFKKIFPAFSPQPSHSPIGRTRGPSAFSHDFYPAKNFFFAGFQLVCNFQLSSSWFQLASHFQLVASSLRARFIPAFQPGQDFQLAGQLYHKPLPSLSKNIIT